MRTIFCVGFAIFLGSGISGAQERRLDSETARGEHPEYGEPERTPLEPDPVILTPELFPAELDPEKLRLTESLMDLSVFREGNESLGRIADLVIDVEKGQLVYLLVRPDAGFGQETTVDYAISPAALTVRSGHLYMTESPKEAETSPILTEAGLRALVEDEVSSQRLPEIVLVERTEAVSREMEYGQPPERTGTSRREIDSGEEEAVVPPEVRGGVPPEHRGGVSPETRTPVSSGTGLDPAGPTNGVEARQ